MFKKMILVTILGLNTLVFAQVNVVVSILPQQTFVQKIGGDKVDVTTMVKPGSDPHSYEPKPSQMLAISKADVFFPIRIEFENAWLERFSEHNPKMQFSDMTKGVNFIKMAPHTHSHKHNHSNNRAMPYEWVGAFKLEKGTYYWNFSKLSGQYADRTMKLLLIPTKDNNETIKAYKSDAITMFNKTKVTDLNDGETMKNSRDLYKLHFNQLQDDTEFKLEVDKSGTYLIFTEHMPQEFVNKKHFFKDSAHQDMKAFKTNIKDTFGQDPHTWTSPSNVKIMAKNIFDTLVALDEKNSLYYKNNYEKFLQEIEATHSHIKKLLTDVPNYSKFMVFHPSWGYFAKEYNLIQLPIEVEGKTPKPKTLAKIIKKAKSAKVQVIFAQKEFSDKSAKAIADELGIKVLKETPLALKWSENLIKMADAIANNK